MPMTLTLFGSYNQDAVLFSYTLLIIYFANKIYQQSNNIETNLIFLQILSLFLIIGRPTYLTFLLLPLYLIINYSGLKYKQLLFFLIISLLAIIFIKTYPAPAISNTVNFPEDIIKIIVLICKDTYLEIIFLKCTPKESRHQPCIEFLHG